MNTLNRKLYLPLLLILVLLLAACVPVAPMPVAEPTAAATAVPMAEPTIEEVTATDSVTRETGATVTVQKSGDVTVHSYLAPEQVFASNTHILELPNSLVLIDAQFLLPNAMDFRAYADSLGKPIDRLIITHAHPDHFLGSEAFADVDVYALAEVAASIEANGQAEVDEKQADFGPAIAGTFVVPMVLEPGTVEIDGVTFLFEGVTNAEAEVQAVTKLPDYGIVSVGDIVYSGVHLILAGAPPTWIEALENLKAERDTYPIVLPGHGATTDPSVYDANIAWLMKAGELMGTVTSGEEFKAGLVDAFPELGMEAAIDFVLPFLFPSEDSGAMESDEGSAAPGLIEVITVALADGASVDDFLPANDLIREEYASLQPGYLARETAVSEDGQVRLAVYWESKTDSDNSIAGFGEAPGLEEFMAHLNAETMVIKQYELRSGSDQVEFSGSGAVEVITFSLNEGADVEGFLAANDLISEEYVTQQPGFIGRQTGVTEEGEWAIIVHWTSASDSEASIAGFESAPGVGDFMSFIDAGIHGRNDLREAVVSLSISFVESEARHNTLAQKRSVSHFKEPKWYGPFLGIYTFIVIFVKCINEYKDGESYTMNWRNFSLLFALVGVLGLVTACQTTQIESGQSVTEGNNSLSAPRPTVAEPMSSPESAFVPLPERAAPRTRTSGTVPHVQIGVEPVQAVNDELYRRAFALPDVENRPTIASLPGADGMWLSGETPVVQPEVIVAGREFAHIHPDGSLHAPLPYERALEAVEKGWAERHPWADQRDGWEGFVMLFTPQTMDELDVTFQLIIESYSHVTGRTVHASDFTD